MDACPHFFNVIWSRKSSFCEYVEMKLNRLICFNSLRLMTPYGDRDLGQRRLLDNGMLPDGTKPLAEPIFTDHQSSCVAIVCEQRNRKCFISTDDYSLYIQVNIWICSSWWRQQMETFSTLLALYAGSHQSSVNFPHKRQLRGALTFSLTSAWINDWVNNLEAGDLRRHRAHYDAIVMCLYLEAPRHTNWFSFHN